MRVLVTGNLGYLGVAVVAVLKAAGHAVVGLDNDYYRDGHFTLPDQPVDTPERQLCQDIRDVEAGDLAGIDAVIHLAALSNDPTGELDPALTDGINHLATMRLARLARAAGVRRFIFSSSCSIYGQAGDRVLDEEAPFLPQTAYARSKVDAEAGLAALAGADFSPIFLRNGTAYGLTPKLRFDLVVNNLTGSAVTSGEVKLLSDGRAWRPLVHVQDIAAAFRLALEAPREAVHNQAFNVGADEDNFQVRTIAERVAAVVPGSRVTFGEGAGSDNRSYHVSFAKIRRHLPEFRTAWTLERGIAELYEACRSVGLTADAFAGRRYTRLKQLRYLLETQELDSALRWRRTAGRP
jgi:nucleoside-diphosphate-sugar epimerase